MKKTLLIGLLILAAGASGAQNTWTQKADLTGAGRNGAFGFSIGTKGYIGSGTDGVGLVTDFWEWDQTTNTWSQKASTPGPRQYASAFTIGTKGYMAMGWDGSSYRNDMWEYDQTLNTWTAKASCPAPGRYFGTGFAIGTNGYVALGATSSVKYDDLWEWNSLTNTWTQRANYPGSGRWAATGFAVGGKGYIGAGLFANTTSYNDFWEWDPTNNLWTQKASIPGMTRCLAVNFVMGNGAFVGLGSNGGTVATMLNDFYYWDAIANTWTSVATFSGTSRISPVGFTIGQYGYVGTGYDGNDYLDELWEYAANYVNIEEQPTSAAIIVFPNPAGEMITFKVDAATQIEDGVLTIFDVQGASVRQITGIAQNEIRVDLSGLASGMYTYSFTAGTTLNTSGRFIVQ